MRYGKILFSMFGFGLLFSCMASWGADLPAKGEIEDFRIPDALRKDSVYEGYFYTHGPVMVYSYEAGCAVTIRDPLAPDPPVASGTADPFPGIPFQTSIPAGFYYISVTKEAGVLVGVDATHGGSGFYARRSSGEAYGDQAEASFLQTLSTGEGDNLLLLFSPGGASEGDIIWSQIDLQYWDYTIDDANDFFRQDSPGYKPYLEVEVDSGNPVIALTRDGPGYFAPEHSTETSTTSTFYTYRGINDELQVHSFADGTSVSVYDLGMIVMGSPQLIWSGTLDDGQTYKYSSPIGLSGRYIKVSTTKGQASVSVMPGEEATDTSFMTFVNDPVGHMQGTDFITECPAGGSLLLIGLEDATTVEVRDASTSVLHSFSTINQSQVYNAAPGAGIWRIRADKDITALVMNGQGGTFVPLTENTSGSTPFPPVITGVTYRPFYPKTTDSEITVRWLTDEMATTKINYKIGSGGWVTTGSSAFAMEHSWTINIDYLTQDTEVRFTLEATDQSGMTTTNDNNGEDYVVLVREDTPELAVTLENVYDYSTYYSLQFRVANNGAGDAHDIVLSAVLEGMQPFSDTVTCNYTSVDPDRITALIPISRINAGDTTFCSLQVIPFLSYTNDSTYRLTEVLSQADDAWGNTTYGTHEVSNTWVTSEIEGRLLHSDYVILANLDRFFSVNSSSDPSAQAMPIAMGRFAAEKPAALVYITTGDVSTIRSYIQGRFHGKIDGDWLDAGYLLLVGCSFVMPAYNWELDCPFTSPTYVHMADNTYANINNDDNFTPELCIGRVTGEHPDTYVSVFDRNRTEHFFEKAISISGTGDGEGSFAGNARECRDRLAVIYPDTPAYFRLSTYAQANRTNVYLNNANNVDFLYYRDHGWMDNWDDFWSSTVPSISFGGKFPIIYSNACLTGQISWPGDLAETFLGHCASVFIGATEVSPRGPNNSLGNKITARHRDGQTIGMAFRNAKRSLAGDIHWYTNCWSDLNILSEILMYNLYGDPDRGGSSSKGAREKIVFDEPQDSLSLSLPMFVVETGEDGLDHVSIPDEVHGDHLLLQNEPLVPIYRWTATYAPGVRVNDITMTMRDVKTNSVGLSLPTTWGSEKTEPGPGDVPSPGIFPPDDYHWTTIERPDGGLEVVLTVHPFFYNAETGDATYYQEFDFAFDLADSTISILAVTPTYDAVPIGSSQKFDIAIENWGASDVTVNMDLVLSDMDTREPVVTLSQNNFNINAGQTVVRNLVWNPTGQPETRYQGRVRVEDALTGDEYAVGYCRFRVGVQDVLIPRYYFETEIPSYVGDAEDVELGMEIESSGDVPVSGTAIMEIRRYEDGLLLEHWGSEFNNLAPGATYAFDLVWSSAGIPQGKYRFSVWVEYSGGCTVARRLSFQTLRDMWFGWNFPGDVFRRGDKIVLTGDLHRDDGTSPGLADGMTTLVGQTLFDLFEPTVEEHLYEPHYSTSFMITAAKPEGLYAIITSATKTSYRDTVGVRWFAVNDRGFAMSADPAVCPADGNSVVTITSEVVYEGGAPIPDDTLMTVVVNVGTILTEDADEVAAGHQVASLAGRYTIEWQAPNQRAYNGFLYGHLGTDRPASGVSVVFKEVDFNKNGYVDAGDIVNVAWPEGSLIGTDGYDRRFDMNEDGVIDLSDVAMIESVWSTSLNGVSVKAATYALSVTATYGAIVRPVPERATLLPGEDLTIDIVADGLLNLGAVEFTANLSGDALIWTGDPQSASPLEAYGNTQNNLGPVLSYSGDYLMGAFATGGNQGPSSGTTVARLYVSADQLGESTLTLSNVVLAQVNGTERRVLRSLGGLYQVAEATPTPTQTAVFTPTPTLTATPEATPTPTQLTEEGDTNGDGEVNALDLFYFSQFWKSPAGTADERCNPIQGVVEDEVNANDLVYLLGEWMK